MCSLLIPVLPQKMQVFRGFDILDALKGEPRNRRLAAVIAARDAALRLAGLAHPHSKNLRTPGRASRLEDRVGLRGGAGGQLLHAQRALQLAPGEAAEVNRAKRTDVTTQLGRVVGAADAIGTNPPAAAIPRAKFIGHRDDHGTLCLIRPCRQRSLDVEEAYPDAVAKAETEAARLREQQKQRMIEGEEP